MEWKKYLEVKFNIDFGYLNKILMIHKTNVCSLFLILSSYDIFLSKICFLFHVLSTGLEKTQRFCF